MTLILAASAGFLLLVDAIILQPAPGLFRLLHPGPSGYLLQPLLLVAATLAVGPQRWRPAATTALVGLLALLVCPMVALDQWAIPLSHAWRWAASGSVDGWFAALPGTLVAAPALVLLLATAAGADAPVWLHRSGKIATVGLCFLGFLAPWTGVLAQAVLYDFGSGPRMLTSALLQSGVLGLGLWAATSARAGGNAWNGIEAASSWGRAALTVLPPVALLAAYLALKLETVSWSATDENIYFYDIVLMSQGKLPYRDFFFAHPPLHIVLPALLTIPTAPSFLVLKLVPVAASMVSGTFLYLAGLQHGRLAGLAGATFFLFAMEQLQASTNLTGINLTVMFVCGAVWGIASGRHLLSGILGGLGVLTGVYASVPVLALMPVAALAGMGGLLKLAAGFAATACGGNLLLYALFGQPFLDQVYRYHFLKEAKVEGFLAPSGIDLAGLTAAGLLLTVGVLAWSDLRSPDHPMGKRGGLQDLAPSVGRWIRSRRGLALSSVGVVLAACVVWACSAPDGAPGGLGLLWNDFGRFVEDQEFLRFFFFHPHLVLAPLMAMISLACLAVVGWLRTGAMAGGAPDSPPGAPEGPGGMTLPAAACCVGLGALAELALLPESYTFYYVLLIPGPALLLGSAVAWTVEAAATTGRPHQRDGVRDQTREPPVHRAAQVGQARAILRSGATLLVLLVGVLVHFLWVPVGLEVGAHRFPHAPAGLTPAMRAGLAPGTEVAGDLTCYDIKDNVASPFSSVVRERILPRCRFQGSMEAGAFHYLWKKKWYFSRAGELADFIRMNSEEGETITGSSLLAPLLAMLSGRPVAADFVDTNTKRFKTGMVDRVQVEAACGSFSGEERDGCTRREAERLFWKKVCSTRLRFIVAGPDSFFTPQRMMRHPLVRRHFRPELFANEPHLNMNGRYGIVLFRRVTESPLADGSWCSMEAGPR